MAGLDGILYERFWIVPIFGKLDSLSLQSQNEITSVRLTENMGALHRPRY